MSKIKETGFFREQWTFFKKGKNEINFMMNVYQTLILLFSMSFIGNLPLSTLLILTSIFVIMFIIIANRIGKYTARKVDTSGFYVSPYFQDQTRYRINLLKGILAIIPLKNIEARMGIIEAIEINKKWLK